MNRCRWAAPKRTTWKSGASGEPPQFDFEPKAHWDLGPELGILDLERAAKITGARFALYWGMGAKLERALINFMLDVHTREHGYTEVLPPFMVNSAQPVRHRPACPNSQEDLFKCEGHDYWLIPTAEVPVTNIYRDETLEADALPIKLCAYTPCFRSEAGSYGRDVRGIIRAAPVPEGGTGEVHPSRAELRRARKAHRRCRRHPAPPRTAIPHRGALDRRHGLLLRQDLRHRSLAAGAERLQGDFVLLQFRSLSGAPRRHSFQERQENGIRPHDQRQRPRGGPHLGCHRRELPAAGWQRRDPEVAAAVS